MSKNYATLAQQTATAIDGVDNVAAVTHCVTRLRFVIRGDEETDSPTLRDLTGVLGVVRSDSQRRVIVGSTTSQACREVVNLLPGDLRPAEPQGKTPLALECIGAGILDTLISAMLSLTPAITGESIVKLLAMVLEMGGALSKGSSTLTFPTLIGDGALFLLPLMVAASAAARFKTNMSLAITITGMLVRPGFTELVTRTAQGEHVEFAFIPVTVVKYTYTVIPALVMTWCLPYIERWVDHITPVVTKNLLKPILVVLITAPLTILPIGPLGIWAGSTISALVHTIHNYLGWLLVAIMGGLWPLLVMTGMHHVFMLAIIQTIAETDKEGTVMPSEIGASLLLGGSSLTMAWKTRNPELRQTALATATSAILAEISEPTLHGVAVCLRHPLITSLVSGFIYGVVAGIVSLASHSMAVPRLFISIQFFDPANLMTIVWVSGAVALSVVLSFTLTLVPSFEDISVEQAAADAIARQAWAQTFHA